MSGLRFVLYFHFLDPCIIVPVAFNGNTMLYNKQDPSQCQPSPIVTNQTNLTPYQQSPNPTPYQSNNPTPYQLKRFFKVVSTI